MPFLAFRRLLRQRRNKRDAAFSHSVVAITQ
jgi:hypothetical protein